VFEGIFQPMHLMVIAGIALLIFGPKKLPELGKGLGDGIRGFKSAMAARSEDEPSGVPPVDPTIGKNQDRAM
jgi:sec-independent protein translocase protein TatA